MKKKNIVNLIRYYVDHNDTGFRAEAAEIANDFFRSGDDELARYISGLLSDVNYLIPQTGEVESSVLRKYDSGQDKELLLFPDCITEDLIGIINAVNHKAGINKFLFKGAPGTGKTEGAKKVAQLLGRELYVVLYESLVDSKLGQTQKNIISLFDEINSFSHPDKVLILFDEIDAIALDRTDARDLREMGRAASTLLRGLDELNKNIVLIATTNLYSRFDKAILRRFDFTVDFDRYSQSDLNDIADQFLNYYLTQFGIKYRNTRLFRKIIDNCPDLPNPGEMKNIIRTAVAFSNPKSETDYLQKLYKYFIKDDLSDPSVLIQKGFTLREAEVLTGISRSTISRGLKDNNE